MLRQFFENVHYWAVQVCTVPCLRHECILEWVFCKKNFLVKSPMNNCTIYYANHRLSVVYEGFIRAAKSVNIEFTW